jgi:putative serine protease PepD
MESTSRKGDAMPVRRALARRTAVLASAAVLAGGAGGGVATLVAQGGTTKIAPTTTVVQGTSVSAGGSSVAAIYKGVAAGVVEVDVTAQTSSGRFGGTQQSSGEGSGFVLDQAGHIVTNEHVVAGATSVTVLFADGTRATATVVGADASTDVAVLKVNVAATKLHPLTLDSSASVQVGEGVLAIGSPFGLSGSLTTGIVSALGRTIDAPDGTKIRGVIQTDAAINPGNSGGPLLNADGEVIGVNAQIESSSNGNEGVGFAIPIATVESVAASLIGGTAT